MRPDHTRYAADPHLCADDNNTITYLVDGADLVKPGTIEYQIHAHTGKTRIKSWIAKFEILPGLSDLRRPTLKPDWVCKLMDTIHDTDHLLDEAAGYRDQTKDIAADARALVDEVREVLDEVKATVDDISVVFVANKFDLPAVGESGYLYVVGDAIYVWRAEPPGYLPIAWDAEEALQGVVIDCNPIN